MAVLAECPLCHRKQKVSNKLCTCGTDMDKAKRGKKVRYHIAYRVNGKQRREFVGYSIMEAKDADSKRKVQKRENRFFEPLPEADMKFRELTEWYLDLQAVKNLKDNRGIKIRLNNFNEVLGEKVVQDIKPTDLENYQHIREAKGIAGTTIDLELTNTTAVVSKAFDDDLVSGRTLKVFKKWKKRATKAERSRDRTLTLEEYLALLSGSVEHLKGALILGFHTGMRPGEIKQLDWSHIDLIKGFIRLPAAITKENRDKVIPINRHVEELLRGLPRPLMGGYVLTYAGRPLGHLKTSLRTACENAGIGYGKKAKKGFILHDLRRTFKTNMARAGVDKVFRDTIVGHSLEGMDAHYMKPSEEDLAEAMAKYTSWLDNEIANVDHSVDHENSSS